MSSRIVITDDITNEELPKGSEYFEVQIMERYNNVAWKYIHCGTWEGVVKLLSGYGGEIKEVTIRRNEYY